MSLTGMYNEATFQEILPFLGNVNDNVAHF